MSNATDILLSSFEEKLKSILDSREEKERRTKEMDEASFARYGSKDPEQIRLHEIYMQQPRTFQTGINLKIDSDELASELHNKISELIVKYPIEEVDWFKFSSSNTWHFKFNY